MIVLFKGASKCKETREERLFLGGDKGWNALPYLVRLKRAFSGRMEEEAALIQ